MRREESIHRVALDGKVFGGEASALPIRLLRLLWGLNLALALAMFVAGLAAQSALTFGHMPGQPEIDAVPALADVMARSAPAAGDGLYSLALVFALVQAVIFVALGLVLFRRKSGDVMGIVASWLLIAIGLGFTPTIVYLPLLWPGWHLPATIFQAGLFVVALLFLCLFPDGRFFPAWSRYTALAWSGYVLIWLFFPQLNPHRAVTAWPALVFAAIINLGIVFQLLRYRRLSDPSERRGARWVVAGFAVANTALVGIALFSVSQTTSLHTAVLILLSLTPTLIPITLVVAIQRQRLWDIGQLVRKTLVYSLLTVLLLGTYFTSVVVLQNLMATITGRREPIAIILSTLLIAALFQPVRSRIQRGINRLMFGERDDPYAVLSGLSRHLRETTVPGEALRAITATITRTLKLPYAAIELATGDESQTVSADGRLAGSLESWPLLYQGEIVGRLLVAPRSPGEPFTPRERQLLADIATQAGAAAHSARLMTALQQSRERLVLAREEERRRIRRDLHDELGPALASQTFKLDAAIDLLSADPVAASELLQMLKQRNQTLVGDIRRLVYELRPPALDELGLLGALRAHFTQPREPLVSVAATPDPLPPLPAAVEVAAYRIALEAVNNVMRHAEAGRCAVTLWAEASRLTLTVADNGMGLLDSQPRGVGLRSMRERAEELGGTLAVENLPVGGVCVTAHLPIATVP